MCLQQCNPDKLDCVAGCHNECEQPFIAQCKQEHPERDCVADAQASCTMHCNSACGVTVDSCLEHCQECCHGACTSQANLSCDINCFAKLEGGCNVQCDEPTGAIFCNDQYVFASDVTGCITYLATQGINVDVSARASATCDLSGCNVDGAIDSPLTKAAGCSAAPAGASGRAAAPVGALSVVGLAVALRGLRFRRRQG